MSQDFTAPPSGADAAAPKLRLHPLRELLYAEPHTRPFQSIPTPARISHIAVLQHRRGHSADLEHIGELCERYSVNRPAPDSACFQQRFGSFELRWEQHLEFSTYTLIKPITETGTPFEETALDCLPRDWLANIDGRLVVATHLLLTDHGDFNEPDSASMARHFEGHSLITSVADRGRARLWTAFRLHADGFGRFIVHNRGMSERRSGRLVQRLLEVETYRVMALLSLPMAKSLGPEISRMDDELAEITQHLAEDSGSEAQTLLDRLSTLAARIEAHRARSNHRFAATHAYYDLAMQRLEELREQDLERHLSMSEFLTRRLTPAVHTCAAAGRRLEDLSKRIDRSSDLLRARINLAIEAQNQTLLASMNRRSRQQLRLQKTVESMSIAAISFAVVGLLDIALSALDGFGRSDLHAWLVSGSIPLVVLLVWLAVRHVRRRVGDEDDDVVG